MLYLLKMFCFSKTSERNSKYLPRKCLYAKRFTVLIFKYQCSKVRWIRIPLKMHDVEMETNASEKLTRRHTRWEIMVNFKQFLKISHKIIEKKLKTNIFSINNINEMSIKTANLQCRLRQYWSDIFIWFRCLLKIRFCIHP